jgi:hypothetical protein
MIVMSFAHSLKEEDDARIEHPFSICFFLRKKKKENEINRKKN